VKESLARGHVQGDHKVSVVLMKWTMGRIETVDPGGDGRCGADIDAGDADLLARLVAPHPPFNIVTIDEPLPAVVE
jgi:hypothetical protein